MQTVIQNVVFPTNGDPDLLALYFDAETWGVIDEEPVRLTSNATLDSINSRESMTIEPSQRISFASYFNAFPASYWQRWTNVREVTLELQTSGAGTILLYRSNASGQQQRIESRNVSGSTSSTFTFPLTMFGDGGWVWFDLMANDKPLTLTRGKWITDATPTKTGKLSLGMTTFNKADYCVETLTKIAGDTALRSEIDQIFLVDQGTQLVADANGYDEVAAQLGEQLRPIRQANLGGSGGFARSMYETLQREDTDFLLLLDDDIEFETESALRGLQFSRFCATPTIVGGHMFDLLDKPVQHAWAEIVRPEPFIWGPSFPAQHRHDFRQANLRQTPWMHARLDADYNGWWMCMIPKQVIQEIGLSLPLFIKWDDAEYGLRAKAAGFRTVSLPGMALWHVSWLDKDDSQDWQAYFHARNRVIAGLLHSDQPRSGRLMQNVGRNLLKQTLNMQYYAAQLGFDGLRAVLDGPAALFNTLPTAMPNARKAMSEFPETRIYTPDDPDVPIAVQGRALPHSVKRHNNEKQVEPVGPWGAKLAAFTARALADHWRRTQSETDAIAPEYEYSKRDAFWWVIPHYRSVIIGSADGRGKMWYRFDREKFRRLTRETQIVNNKIRANWDKLAKEYRAALPQLTSPESWEPFFTDPDSK